MPYYKFGPNDIFNNTIETHPKSEFLIHNRKLYYNGYIREPSSHSSESAEASVKHVPSGYISLYEINIDRQASLHDSTLAADTSVPPATRFGTMIYPFIIKSTTGESLKAITALVSASTGETLDAESQNLDFVAEYGDLMRGAYPMSASLSIERYVIDGDDVDDCNNFPAHPGLLSESDGSLQTPTLKNLRSRMLALKNTMNHYKYLSPYYDFSYYGDDKEVNLVSIPSIFYGSSIKKGSVSLKYYITGSLAAELQDTKRNGELIQVFGAAPSASLVFTGVPAEEATVTITDYEGTSVIFEIDDDGNGVSNPAATAVNPSSSSAAGIATALYTAINASALNITATNTPAGTTALVQGSNVPAAHKAITYSNSESWGDETDTLPTIFSSNFGDVAGVVLYNEGFIALTGDWSLDDDTSERYNWCPDATSATEQCDNPKWKYWGQLGDPDGETDIAVGPPINTSVCKSSNVPYSSFAMSFEGTNYIPTTTMLAHAKKGELNHSSNPTYLTHDAINGNIVSLHDTGSLYIEKDDITIKNTVKSPYEGHDALFQKQTWISQIGIYDEDKNLIAVAKLANPVRKTEDREFTFKLKLDF